MSMLMVTIGVLVLSFLVAYAAMFGFDKLREAMTKLNELKLNE